MELASDNAEIYTQSHVAGVELRQGVRQVYTDKFASNSDTSKGSSLEGRMQVCLRIRPFTSLERKNELQECVSTEDSTSIILKHPKTSLSQLGEKNAGQMMQKFTFSRVFGPEATQEEFFEGTMKQSVQDFIDGYNRLIFTYGVTNSGKTYTIQGTEDDPGILPRTMDLLFESIQENLYTAMDLKPHRFRDYIKLTKDQVREEIAIKNSILRLTKEVDHHNSTNKKALIDSKDLEELLKDSEQSSTTVKNYKKFSVWISFFEIYNECFYDLLNPISNAKKRKPLRLSQDVRGVSYIKDLCWIQVSDSKEAFRLLKLGLKRQSFASTKLNTCSSRSHSVFTVKILKIEDSGAPRVTQVNELSICDLAGSERYTKTQNVGGRLKESGNINTSLLTLSKCINALKNCQRSKLGRHIPFRESKLTHFLQGYFSGKGKVYMIVNISQCASAYDETLHVLKFSAIAQKVLLNNVMVLPRDQSYGQKSAGESSLRSDTKMPVSRERYHIPLDRSLETVIEDTDGEMEEQHNTSKEEAVQKCKEKEKYTEDTVDTLTRERAENSSKKVTKRFQSKDCEETGLEVRRKRCFENKPAVEEAPPRKKGYMESFEYDSLNQEKTECVETNTSENYAEILALKERAETLEGQLAALEEQCRRENKKKEELHGQITNLHVKLSASEEKSSRLSAELQQCRADYQEIVSELSKQKTVSREQEEKLIQLNNEVEDAKQNIIENVSQITTVHTKVNKLYKHQLDSYAMDIDLPNIKDSLDSQKNESERAQMSSACIQPQTASTADLRQESAYHCTIGNIWEECKNMIKASSQKSQRIQELLEEVEGLKRSPDDTENYNNQLKIKLNEVANHNQQSLKIKDLTHQLQAQIQKKTEDFEKQAAEDHRVIAQLMEEVAIYKEKIGELERLLEAFRAKDEDIRKLEEVLKEKESIILNLESNTVALQEKCVNSDEKLKELNGQEAILKEEVKQLMNSLENMKCALQEKEKKEDEQIQYTEMLRRDLSESCSLAQSLKKDLERKEEEYTDLKERYSDAKKQIQQLKEEVCNHRPNVSSVCKMQSEENSLRKKVCDLQRMQKQFSEELENKQRIILQLKNEQLNNEKLEEISKKYKKTCEDLRAKEKTIEDMQMTLEEQERTQAEQDKVIQANLEETNRLGLELEAWKQKYTELSKQTNRDWQQKMSKNEEKNLKENEELIKLQTELKENEAKYQTDRKKWLEEKVGFINQIKEAEELHNREMRKFAESQERHVVQQAEIKRLAGKLVEKDNNLRMWREERDNILEALRVQLKIMASKVMQKDKEIENLKRAALKDSGKIKETEIELRKQLAEKDEFVKELKQCINHESHKSLAEVSLPEEGHDKIDQSVNQEDRSEIVHDSYEESTENEKTNQSSKSEMEIQFTCLQRKNVVVKHQGSKDKVVKPKNKRKIEEMDEDLVESEDKKNAEPATPNSPSTSSKKMVSTTKSFRKYSLRNRGFASSKTSAEKKDVTLQKTGDFLQRSSATIHSKVKNLIVTMNSHTSAESENVKENEPKPKQTKRKLYSTNISSHLDICAASIFVEEKESDHLTTKRQLRSRPAK